MEGAEGQCINATYYFGAQKLSVLAGTETWHSESTEGKKKKKSVEFQGE